MTDLLEQVRLMQLSPASRQAEYDRSAVEAQAWREHHMALVGRLLHVIERLRKDPQSEIRQAIDMIEDAVGVGQLARLPYSGKHRPLGLSERRLTALRLVAHGLSRTEVGDQLRLAPTTVSTMLGHIYEGLSARNAAHAVYLAGKQNLWNSGEMS